MFTILFLLAAAFALWYFRKEIQAFFTAHPDPLAEAEQAVKTEFQPAAKAQAPATGAATPTGPPKV